MGIYYYAVDTGNKEYFRPPIEFSLKSPGIYHPENPFPHMVIMKNVRGYRFEIYDDVGNDIPSGEDYKDVTNEVYDEYLHEFSEYFLD